MGNYLKSKNVTVFPSVNRSVGAKGARLFTEYNLVHLINQLTDTDSFIISNELDLSNPVFEFNIAGYYFKVDSYVNIISKFDGMPVSLGDNIYAEIKIDNNNELSGYDIIDETIVSSDVDERKIYNGVDFYKTSSVSNVVLKEIDGDYTIYRLPLFTFMKIDKPNPDWQIEQRSKIKFTASSILVIDGGVD